MSNEFQNRYTQLANLVSEKHTADVILYSGDIDNAPADQLIEIAKHPLRRENVVLLLTTQGGSPDAAYRMAHCLQRQYKKIVLYIYGACKSAGTLISIAAHEIILSDFGEFGPLDIQLGKRDELFETVSGLNITQALISLDSRAQDLFRSTLLDLKQGSRGQISTKLAAEIASDLTIGLYGSIYAQIDPALLGSIERAINIASDYGERLKTENVKEGTIDKLVSSYPSHSFVIDIEEARTLFSHVNVPCENEESLAKCFPWFTRDAAKDTIVIKLNTIISEAPTDEHTTDTATD